MNKFNTVESIISKAKEENITLSHVILKSTAHDMDITEDEVFQKMKESLFVMKTSIEDGLNKDLKSVSGITGGNAFKMKKHIDSKNAFVGTLFGEVIYSALAVSELNACMGRIVAAPTAGSCGIIPACLFPLQKKFNFTDDELVYALINSSGIGTIIAKNATIAGAKGGCQAECGSAAAMAASAIVELFGGTPDMCGYAAATAIKSMMGLVCDPVAGLVEEPCVIRNVSSATIALSSAQMALAGIESIIPIDEVISAMDEVGKQLPPSLRETAEGGIAITPTGKKIQKRVIN